MNSLKFLLFPVLIVVLATTGTSAWAGNFRSGDVDGNGIVDEHDLAKVLLQFGTWCDTLPCPADRNQNGYVGNGDLQIVLATMGRNCLCSGDADGDGDVDDNDLNIVLESMKSCEGRNCRPDFDRDGTIGEGDLNILRWSLDTNPDPDRDPRADLNGDGRVDDIDLAQVLLNFGLDARGDVNDDGVVDDQDVAIVLSNMGCALQ